MKLSKNVQKILQFGFDNNLEVVSYGLAPNPNGFCFESHPNQFGKEASDDIKRAFHNMLESLNRSEVNEVKKAMF